MLLLLSIETDSPFIRVPVGLLHRIVEAEIGNKQKKLWITVFLILLMTLLIELLQSVCIFSDEK